MQGGSATRRIERPIACFRQLKQDASAVVGVGPARSQSPAGRAVRYMRCTRARQGSKRTVSLLPSGRPPPIFPPKGDRKRADALVPQGRIIIVAMVIPLLTTGAAESCHTLSARLILQACSSIVSRFSGGLHNHAKESAKPGFCINPAVPSRRRQSISQLPFMGKVRQ